MEILTEEDKRAILEAERMAEALRAEIQKAKRAGIDTTALEAELQELTLRIQNIKRVYITPTTKGR
jgi:predicted RNA-binding protein with EMAP domain